MILIRFMAEKEYALYTFALSIVMVCTQALTSSFNRIYIIGYENLRIKDPSFFLGFQLLGISIVAALTIPLKNYVGGIYWLLVFLIISISLTEFAKTVFQKELRFIRFSLVELFRSLLFLIVVLFLVYIYQHNLKAWQVLIVQASAMLLTFIFALRNRLNIANIVKFQENIRIVSSVVTGSYKYLFGYFFLLAIFSQIDVFALKLLSNDKALASYGSAFRYYNLLLLSLGAIHSVLLPTIQHIKTSNEFADINKKLTKLLIVFAPATLIGAWASQWIIPLIDHGKYPDAVMVFRILSISAIISFAFSPHVNLVMRFEDFKFLFILIIAALISDIVINIVLVPHYHAVGSAIATFIAFGCVNGMIYLRARSKLKSLPIGRPDE